jgi:hypothetical protein
LRILDVVVIVTAGYVGVLDVFFLLGISARHGADVGVTGCPAADLITHANFGAGEHDGGLDFMQRRLVFLVSARAGIGRRLETEADVEIFSIVGSLHGDREFHGFRCRNRLQFLAGQTLEVEVERAFFLMASGAGLSFADADAATVFLLVHQPFNRRYAGVENLNIAFGDLAPVRRCGLRAKSQKSTKCGHTELSFFHCLLCSIFFEGEI